MKKIAIALIASFSWLNAHAALDNLAPSDYYRSFSDERVYFNTVPFPGMAERQVESGVCSYDIFTDIYTYLLTNSDAITVSDFNYELNATTSCYYPGRSGTYIFNSHPNVAYSSYGTSYTTPFLVGDDKIYQDYIGYCWFYNYTDRASTPTNLLIPWENGTPCLDSFTYAGDTWHSLAIYFGTTPPDPPEPPVPPTPPPEIPGVACTPYQIPNISTADWWDFFDLPFTSTGTGTSTGSNGAITNRAAFAEAGNADLSDYDLIIANGVNAAARFNTGALDYPGTATAVLAPGSTAVNGNYVMNFESTRDGGKRKWNLLQFFNVPSFPLTNTWGFFYNLDNDSDAVRMEYDGSGTVTLASTVPVNNFAITAISGFSGMRVGTSTGTTTYYQCSGSNGNECELNMSSTGVTCQGASEGIIQYGNCTFVTPTACAPVTQSGVVVAPNPLPGQVYVQDGSGAVIQTPYYVPPNNSNNVTGIFDCDYVDWTDIIGCAKQIASNIAKTVTSGSNSIGKGSDSMINGNLKNIGNSSGSLSMEPVSGTGNNVAEQIINGSWNYAMAGDDAFANWMRMGFYGAMLIALLIVIGLIILANHSSK